MTPGEIFLGLAMATSPFWPCAFAGRWAAGLLLGFAGLGVMLGVNNPTTSLPVLAGLLAVSTLYAITMSLNRRRAAKAVRRDAY